MEKRGWYLKVPVAGGDCSRTRPERFGTWRQLLLPPPWLSPHHLGPPGDLEGGGSRLVGEWGGQEQGQHVNPGGQQQEVHWQSGSDHSLCH